MEVIKELTAQLRIPYSTPDYEWLFQFIGNREYARLDSKTYCLINMDIDTETSIVKIHSQFTSYQIDSFNLGDPELIFKLQQYLEKYLCRTWE